MNFYNPEHKPAEECEDFKFWLVRFGFARWLFFFMGLGAIIFGKPAKAIIFSFAASFFWFIAEGVLTARHFKWHLENDERHN